MEVTENAFFPSMMGVIDAIVPKTTTRQLMRSHHAIMVLVDTIGLVRQRRTLTHQYLFHRQPDEAKSIADKIERLDLKIRTRALLLASDTFTGNYADRNSLRRQLDAITGPFAKTSFSSNLIEHGKMIRQLIYQIDKQVIALLDKSGKLNCAGQYNEQWQIVMSGIEALTQYRVAIMSMEAGGMPEVLAAQAKVLYSKMVQIRSVCSSSYELNDCIDLLCDQLGAKVTGSASQGELFRLTCDISSALIAMYESIIETTCGKIVPSR